MLPRTNCLAVLLVATATFATTANADDADQKKARTIIDRAIEAQGGAEAVAKQKRILVEDRGTFYGMGQGLPYEGRFAIDFPNRWSIEIVNVFTLVIDGDKGSMVVQGAKIPLDEAAMKEQKLQTHSGYITTLIPLLKPKKEYRLKLFGTEKVDGEECDGVNVERDDYRTVTLLFSRDSGLLKKSVTVVVDDQTGKEVVEESVYSDFRELDGGKFAYRVTISRDGKKYVESETTKLELPEKLDDALFKTE